MNNDNIIEQYYQGISQQLHAEVNFINNLFQHQGIKGEGNENVLRELLVNFIPKKYGIGTGVVIDRLGQQSKQCDIICPVYGILGSSIRDRERTGRWNVNRTQPSSK